MTDSDGAPQGEGVGAVLGEYSAQVAATGTQRPRRPALQKEPREAGRIAPADRIRKHPLGRQTLKARRERTPQPLRTLAYQAAPSVVDNAATVASEELTLPTKPRRRGGNTTAA